MSHRVLALILLLLPVAAPAQEQAMEEEVYAREGFYAGLGGVFALEVFKGKGGARFDPSLGASGVVGYRLRPHWAVEGKFEWIEGFDVSNGDGELDGWALTTSGKGYLLTDRIQPYLLAGAGISHVEFAGTEDEDLVLRFGLGAEYYATEEIVVDLGADIVVPTDMSDVKGARYLSFRWGVNYRF